VAINKRLHSIHSGNKVIAHSKTDSSIETTLLNRYPSNCHSKNETDALQNVACCIDLPQVFSTYHM
jgi:hypothetical protein